MRQIFVSAGQIKAIQAERGTDAALSELAKAIGVSAEVRTKELGNESIATLGGVDVGFAHTHGISSYSIEGKGVDGPSAKSALVTALLNASKSKASPDEAQRIGLIVGAITRAKEDRALVVIQP